MSNNSHNNDQTPLPPRSCCIKISELRKRGYGSLREWIDAADPSGSHLYVGRFTKFVDGAADSKWKNPFPVRRFGLDTSLDMFVRHVCDNLWQDLEELSGKELGCWCLPGSPCHAGVLCDLFKERVLSVENRNSRCGEQKQKY